MSQENLIDDSQPIERSEFRTQLIVLIWVVVILVSCLARMFVVGEDAIVAMSQDPEYYAQTATYYFDDFNKGKKVIENGVERIIYERGFNRLPLHRPGLPIIAWFTSQLGVPFKLFVDGCLMLLAICIGLTMRRITKSDLIGICSFLLICFNTCFMARSQIFMTEALVAMLLPALLLVVIPWLERPIREWNPFWVIPASMLTVTYVMLRNETPVLLAFWVGVYLVTIFREFFLRRDGHRLISLQNWRILFLAAPLLCAIYVGYAFEKSHQRRFNHRALCTTEKKELKELMTALYSVEPEGETPRYVPVTRETLRRVCDECPTFDSRRDRLLDVTRKAYQFGSKRIGVKDEFGPWMNWHLLDSFAGTAMMRAGANEIRRAQDEGRLGRRKAFYPIDPSFKQWFPDVPKMFGIAMQQSVYLPARNVRGSFEMQRAQNPVASGHYDDGLLRRTGIGIDKEVRVNCVCSFPVTRATLAQIMTVHNYVIATLPIETNKDSRPSFMINLDFFENPKMAGPLAIRLFDTDTDARSEPVLLEGSMFHHPVTFKFPNLSKESHSSDENEYWSLMVSKRSPRRGGRIELKKRLDKLNLRLLFGMIGLTFVVGLVSMLKLRMDRKTLGVLTWIAVVGVGFVVTRSMFYSLLEVWLLWGLHRYIEPNVFLTHVTIYCATFALGGWIGCLMRKVFVDDRPDPPAPESDDT